MLFNSYLFIFCFLPVVLIGFFFIAHRSGHDFAKIWLTLASLCFYGWLGKEWIFLLLGSALFNFIVAQKIPSLKTGLREVFLVFGISINIGLLIYFKYNSAVNFALELLFDRLLLSPQLILPLAISYFTFHQIAYLVDIYVERVTPEKKLINYLLFVTFFPHLLAGPIVYYRNIIPQLTNPDTYKYNSSNISTGLLIFALGLVKKTLIADSICIWVDTGFNNIQHLGQFESWMLASLFSLQVYFDFSGYSDMALGLALLFNVRFPLNFKSPYKSTSILDFWQNWNMTLTHFFTSYVYTPLVRIKRSYSFYYSLFITFVTMTMIGIWHGNHWNYVLFGMLHGVGMVANHLWRKAKFKMPDKLAHFFTIIFWILSVIIFRSNNFSQAMQFYYNCFVWDGGSFLLHKDLFIPDTSNFYWLLTSPNTTDIFTSLMIVSTVIGGYSICLFCPASPEIAERTINTKYYYLKLGALMTIGVMMISKYTPFIYFQF